ncbi:MAG TPA: sigma-70 family RNA polymerase sigma factor [Polyangiaceae bacterium]
MSRNTQTATSRLERMFQEHHECIWRLLRRLGAHPDAAADLVQQVYLIAAERLTDIRPESERAFLFGTALRLSRSRIRRERRCQLEDDMDAHHAMSGSVEEAAEKRRAVAMMNKILSLMEADLVTVFVLYELEEIPTATIAQVLNIPVGTVASRLRRAREAFRSHAKRAEGSFGRARQS